ncbi:MAG TPA: FtsW/RodA/SpoVE family cell cycle protein [Thermoanaerobaculia bacterium]|nr:FtsW/RodA/SpoVE family cell cycle protein [Thermoanaerobaculia bacterium]
MTRRSATAEPPRTLELRSTRGREARLLGAALVIVLLALFLVHRSFREDLAEAQTALEAGELVNLGAVESAAQLERLLPSFTDGRERSFVAAGLLSHARAVGGLPNVGELSRARVSSSELAGWSHPLPVLAQRAAALGASPENPENEVLVPLLSAAQVREARAQAIVRTPASWRSSFWLWTLGALAALGSVHLLWRLRGFSGDQLLLPPVALLCGLGACAMASMRDPLRDLLLLRSFAQGVIAGAVVLAITTVLAAHHLPRLRRLGFPALLGAFALSALLVVFGTGPGTSDAKVNLFGFQPVPVVCLLVVLFLAAYFAERWELLREVRESRWVASQLERLPRSLRWQVPKLEYLLPPLVAMAVVLGFFLLQRDLGPALVLSLLFSGLYYAARGRPGLALLGVSLLALGLGAAYRLGFPRTVTGRIQMWLHPWSNEFAGGDHLAQSLWAFSSGGWRGAGLGGGRPETVPEVHTDLVLAALGEELGFVGFAVVVATLGLVLQRLYRLAVAGTRPYEVFLGLGLFLAVALQALVIAGGALGLLPLTGIVTPFLSYGRSSMLVHFAMLGLAAALSARVAAGSEPEVYLAPLQRSAGAVGRSGPKAPLAPLRRSSRVLGLLVAVAMTAVLGKAAWVQVVAADDTATRGTLVVHADGALRYRYNPRLVELVDRLPRGSVLDRNGMPLATSDPELLGKFRDAYVAMGLEPPSPAILDTRRWYPLGGRSYHLLGDWNRRWDWAASNTSFVERDDNARLQGFDDRPRAAGQSQDDPGVVRGAAPGARNLAELLPLLRHGEAASRRSVRELVDRERNVKLTVDARLQASLADSLARHVREAGRERGAAVVLDATSGELLASASYPWPATGSADPVPGDPSLLDRSRYGLYPPGSTFKVVTAIAALRKDPALARKEYACVALPGGRVGHAVRGWGRPIRDDPTAREPHGELDLAGGLRYSCNAFFAQLGTYDVGAADLLRTAALFGIETARPNTTEALQDALPQSAYGQGQVVATPLEMARVAAAVANGGLLPAVRWVLPGAGDAADGRQPERVLGIEQAERLQAALRAVVTSGSASALRDAPVSLAGKTGTAEIAGSASHSWFIGFAPFGGSGRTIAFAVLVEHGGYGGRVAVRVARDLVTEAAAIGLLQ